MQRIARERISGPPITDNLKYYFASKSKAAHALKYNNTGTRDPMNKCDPRESVQGGIFSLL